MVVSGEFFNFLDAVGGSFQSLKDGFDISTWLHRDDSELIFFIDPNQESFVVIVEDTSARWPVSIKSACFKIFITFLEQEVVSDELLLIFFAHGFQRVVGSL